jgi:hypothetical protein
MSNRPLLAYTTDQLARVISRVPPRTSISNSIPMIGGARVVPVHTVLRGGADSRQNQIGEHGIYVMNGVDVGDTDLAPGDVEAMQALLHEAEHEVRFDRQGIRCRLVVAYDFLRLECTVGQFAPTRDNERSAVPFRWKGEGE